MPRPKKSKAEDLTRIRNNQRKCRERRRDYLAELEQKLKFHENERAQCRLDSAELRATTQKLRQENEILRQLLGLPNISENYQTQSPTDELKYHRIYWDQASTETQKLSDINIEPGAFTGEVLEDETSHGISSLDENPLLLKSNFTKVDNFIAGSQNLCVSNASIFDAKTNTTTPSIAIASPFLLPLHTAELETSTSTSFQSIASWTLWPMLTDEFAREDRTMLCSTAYRLILQFNKKRYSDSEIDKKICHGFRQGRTQLERCRVDNEVLFAVLSEISS